MGLTTKPTTSSILWAHILDCPSCCVDEPSMLLSMTTSFAYTLNSTPLMHLRTSFGNVPLFQRSVAYTYCNSSYLKKKILPWLPISPYHLPHFWLTLQKTLSQEFLILTLSICSTVTLCISLNIPFFSWTHSNWAIVLILKQLFTLSQTTSTFPNLKILIFLLSWTFEATHHSFHFQSTVLLGFQDNTFFWFPSYLASGIFSVSLLVLLHHLTHEIWNLWMSTLFFFLHLLPSHPSQSHAL